MKNRFRENIILKSVMHKPTKLILLLALSTVIAFLITNLNKSLGEIFDFGINGVKAEFFQHFLKLLALLLSFILVNFLTTIVEGRYYHKVLEKTRIGYFNYLSEKSLMTYSQEDYGAYSSTLINDVKLLEEQFYRPLLLCYNQIINLTIALGYTLQISRVITIFIVLASLIPILIPSLLKKRLTNNFLCYSQEMGIYTASLNDYLAGFDVIKTYNSQEAMLAAHGAVNYRTLKTKKSAYDFLSIVKSSTVTASLSIIIGVLLIGMFMAINGKMSIGDMFAITFISSSISAPLGVITESFTNIKASKNIREKFVITREKDRNRGELEKIACLEDKIDFKDLSIKIGEKDILKNIFLTFKIGKKYAIVGASGSGKSTIVKSLLGYYHDYKGSILVNGQDLKTLDMASIYDKIAYLPQTVSFFTGTIKENLSYYKDLPEEKINNSLDFSNIKGKILSLEGQINGKIDRNLKEFSGGEKQRISISRSFLREKEILILDEATSALDEQNYKLIENKILALDKTIIAVTHRLDKDILEKYDEIIVLEKGEIVEKGNFASLLKNKKQKTIFCSL